MARLLPQRGVMGPLVVITMSWLLAGALFSPGLGTGRPEHARDAPRAGGGVSGAVAADPHQTPPP
ncbi:MAG TPA: hypothetical protein PKC49_10115, partial [Phycisphaerae bacterium]|nr:hypothetical protein [Phycisphaerae bacterium]